MQEEDMLLWCRMVSLMEVFRGKHGTRIWVIYFERKLKNTLVLDTSFNRPQVQSPIFGISGYIFQLSIKSSKCSFIKTGLVFYVSLWSECMLHLCVYYFLWSINKLISHVKLFKGYLLYGQRSHFYLLSFFKEGDLWEGETATHFC